MTSRVVSRETEATVTSSSGMLASPARATLPSTVNVARFIAGEPMKPATKTFTGRSYSSRGLSTCCNTPKFSTAMRSPMVSASVWSCVT